MAKKWRSKIEKNCLNCNISYKTTERKSKFCGRKCAGVYNNRRRSPMSAEQKIKISHALTMYYETHPEKRLTTGQATEIASCGTKNKYEAKSLGEMSKRTISKIFKRLGVGCSRCSWNEATCDLHHINGRKIQDPHNHSNLTYLCPNCHRMFHCGKIGVKDVINLNEFIGDKWKSVYYG